MKAVVSVLPAMLTVSDGNMVGRLSCVAKGYPEPTIIWKKNNDATFQGVTNHTNQTTTSFGKYLRIGNVSMSDNGTVYSCEARQLQGSVVSIINRILIVKRTFVPHVFINRHTLTGWSFS